MNIKILLIIIICFCSSAYSSVVPFNLKLLSPDKKNYIELIKSNDEKNISYQITIDNKKQYTLDCLYNPVYKILWSEDSKTIYTVNHAARQTLVQVIYYENNKWNLHTVDIPVNNEHEYYVLKCIVKNKNLIVFCKYIITKSYRNDEYYYGEFLVNPKTGKAFNLKSKKITLNKFNSILSEIY